MLQNPSHANIPEIQLTSRIPQVNGIRPAKPSRIAKPAGIVGNNKLTALPKSLSNEKICQASNLVQNTTKTLFKSRFGKPPEPKRAKMNLQQTTSPTIEDTTFAVHRPTPMRSDTFNKIEPNLSQNIDVGNNLTQNVISKLQEQTFTTANSNPMRMSISPIAPSPKFAVPRQISYGKAKMLASHTCSTPFRNVSAAKFSTKNLCDQQLLPPLSDVTYTDSTTAAQATINMSPQFVVSPNLADTSQPSFLPLANLTNITVTESDNIADTTPPSFFTQCTPHAPIHQQLPSRGKFEILAANLVDESFIADTTTNFFASTSANGEDTIVSRTKDMNATEEDESTIKNTTMVLCLGEPAEVMEVDDRGNVASCGMFDFECEN